ncbi:GNAT family N-acetyltransferase [Actinomycetota bacterium]
MSERLPRPDVRGLPDGWTARMPREGDVPAAVALVTAHRRAARGEGSADPQSVESDLVGLGSWSRRQAVVISPDGSLAAWAQAHDRAAGRINVPVIVDPQLADADAGQIATALYGWVEAAAREIAAERGLHATQLDAETYAADARQQRWLASAAYQHTRTWLHMTRPVTPGEQPPGPREGVRVRRVERHTSGLPLADDLQTVHRMLEESFADHFNSYRESFPEFLQRLREDPGHRWDHWWIAEIDVDGRWEPGGALVSTVLPADGSGAEGSYVDYIGVHRRSRGRGVAKALLHTVIRDAAERGRNRVGLEVDADSPTGADGLYTSMGWALDYQTWSWHRDLTV